MRYTTFIVKVPFRTSMFPNRGLTISLVFLTLATLGSTVFLGYTLISQRQFVRRGTEGARVEFVLQDVYADLVSAESSVRGYYLTGNDAYLDEYRQAQQRVPSSMEYLKRSSALGDQRPQVAELDRLAKARLDQLKRGQERRLNEGRDQFFATANFDAGKASMDQLQAVLDGISERVMASVMPEQRRAESAIQRSLILTPILAAVVLALCVVIARYFRKGIENERAIEGSKNEFLSLASHQLRTPATNVKQYIHLVTDGYFGPIEKEQREALEVASRNNDIEISIINDLLDIAKVDLDQINVETESVNTGRLVRQIMREFREVTKQRKQRLTYTEPKGTPPAELDPTYFKTVVENLIDNASKYSPPHSPIELRGDYKEGRYILTVRDRGVGIPKHDQHKLFKKFSRIPNSLSGAVEGSGLGLYWVKRVVELHKGTITVRSTPDEGTDFIVTLPLSGQPATVPRKTTTRPA